MTDEEQKIQIDTAKALLDKGCTSAPGLKWRLPGTIRRFVQADGKVVYGLATGKDACKQKVTL